MTRRTRGWQPIATAPRDGRPVDLWFAGTWNKRMPEMCWVERNGMKYWCNRDGYGSFFDDADCITHWREIPRGPK
jgi:hypothetical protein